MTTPDKCPKCGAGSANKWATGHEFQCNTLVLAGGDVFEGLICVRAQRDQLASQVVDLESANRELVEALQLAVTHVEFFTSAPKGSMAADARTALISKCSSILEKYKPTP